MEMWLAILACSTPPPAPPGDGGPFTVTPGPTEEPEDTDQAADSETHDTALSTTGTTSEAIGWVDADAGPTATCGVRATGEIECWGDLGFTTVGTPYIPPGPFGQVAVGDRHVCAITTAPRTLVCFGDDDLGQASPPPGIGWVEISAGGHHTCARRASGTVECWGNNNQGQLGLPAGTVYEQIAAGFEHTCALTSPQRTTECVGSDTFGESSDPPGTGYPGLGSQIAALAAGRYVTCAITSNDYGSACRGDAADLQISDQYHQNTDIAVGDGFVAVLGGAGYDARSLHGVGNVPWDDSDTPVDNESWYSPVPTARYTSITAGDRHLCLVSPTDFNLFCLGDNSDGQITIPP